MLDRADPQQSRERPAAARRPPAAAAAERTGPPQVAVSAGDLPLSGVLAAAVVQRATLARNGGGAAAVAEPGAGPRQELLQHVSEEQIESLMNVFDLHGDVVALATLLEAPDYDADGLLELGRALRRRGGDARMAGRLLRKLNRPARLALLVAASSSPAVVLELLDVVPDPELLRTLLLFEHPGDPGWLVDVCTMVGPRERPLLPALLEATPGHVVAPLLALEPSVRTLLGLVRAIDDPHRLVALLNLIADRELLATALRCERNGAVLAQMCVALTSNHDTLPVLLGLVSDRPLLLRLALAERDGSALVALLRAAPAPAALDRLMAMIGDHGVLLATLQAATAQAGADGCEHLVASLHRLNLLAVIADAARLGRVASIIQVAQSVGQDPAEALAEASDFDYHWDFGLAALASADAAKEDVVQTSAVKLKEAERKSIEEAVKSKYKAAFDSFNKKFTKKLDLFGDAGKEARAELLERQRELAAEDIEAIRNATKDKLQKVAEGPAAKAAENRRGQYVAYFKNVHQHPLALSALEAADGQFDLAEQIVAAIVATPALQPVALSSKIPAANLRLLVALPTLQLAQLLGLLPLPQLRACTATAPRLSLVCTLCAGPAPAPAPRIVTLCDRFKTYDVFAAGAAEHVPMRTLLNAYDLDELEALLKLAAAIEAKGAGTMAFLAGLQPHCQDLAAHKECLTFARRAYWTPGRLSAVITPLAAGRSAGQLRTSMHQALAGEFNRDTEFAYWMRALNVLVEDNYCAITMSGWYWLPGNTTLENTCTVSVLNTTFVIHKHPGAQAATVGSAYSSKVHLKPYPGNTSTPRIYKESIPPNIAAALHGAL